MALTANRDVPRFVDQELRTLKVKAAAHIYKGGFVGIDRATGYIRPLAGADLFAGVAYEECDNSSGADGDVSCRLYTQGDFQTTLSGAGLTNIGQPAFATDDDTLTLSPGTNGSQVGRCVDVPKAGEVIVRIEPLWLAQDVHTASARLDSSTSAATTNPIMVTQRPIIVTSVQAVFNVVPDVGLLDVGWANADPDEIVDAYDLTILTNHVAASLAIVSGSVPANARVWAIVGQATSTAGVNGLITLRFIELP